MTNEKEVEQRPPLTNRDIVTYIVGSYLVATSVAGGLGILLSSWRVAVGGTLILGLILAGLTLKQAQ